MHFNFSCMQKLFSRHFNVAVELKIHFSRHFNFAVFLTRPRNCEINSDSKLSIEKKYIDTYIDI